MYDMNILLVSSDNNKTSGAFLCLVSLAKYLIERFNYKVIVTVPKKGDGIELLQENNIPYYYVRSFSWITYNGFDIKAIAKTIFKKIAMLYNWRAIRQTSDIIERENIDIIHINTIFSYVGAVAAKLKHKKVVWHIRESLDKGFNSHIVTGKKGYELINQSDRVIAVSNTVLNEYKNFIHSQIFEVIYDGIDSKFHVPEHKILKKQPVVFACIGALVREKNQLELLRSISKIKDNGITNFKLLLIGDGVMEAQLKSFVNRNQLQNYVEFCGRRKDVDDILKQVDCLFSVSRAEAFGRTMIEGMLSGCLIVAADSPDSAARELIQSGKTGILYPLGDMSKLAEILRNICLYKNYQNLQNMASKGQKEAMMKYSSLTNAEKIRDVYLHICEDD